MKNNTARISLTSMHGLTRDQALSHLRTNLKGRNLHDLAAAFGISVYTKGKLNKGWVGQVVERAAGLNTSSHHGPDGDDFELKSTILVWRAGQLHPRETIKITQLNPAAILEETFESSSLWRKLHRLIVVGYTEIDAKHAQAVHVEPFDTSDPQLVSGSRTFWEEVRQILLSGEITTYDSKATSNNLLQLRPTGTRATSSRCPITGELFQARAFYATKPFIKSMLRLNTSTAPVGDSINSDTYRPCTGPVQEPRCSLPAPH